jgi:hypothetical protein
MNEGNPANTISEAWTHGIRGKVPKEIIKDRNKR